jgi:hypothetical protein
MSASVKVFPGAQLWDTQDARTLRDHAYDRFANIVKDNLDLGVLARLVGI